MMAFNTPFLPLSVHFPHCIALPYSIKPFDVSTKRYTQKRKKAIARLKKKGEKGQKGGVMGHVPSVRIRALFCVDTCDPLRNTRHKDSLYAVSGARVEHPSTKGRFKLTPLLHMDSYD